MMFVYYLFCLLIVVNGAPVRLVRRTTSIPTDRPASVKSTAEPTIGCVQTDFMVPVEIGPSRIPVSLLIDTGSTTTAVASTACDNCVIPSSFTPASFGLPVSSSYADGSGWTGMTTTTAFRLAGQACATNLRIAAITSQNPSFRKFFDVGRCNNNQTVIHDGILGLAGIELAKTGTDAAADILLNGRPFSITECDNIGELWIDGPDTTNTVWNYSAVLYAKRTARGFYGVQFRLRLAGVDITTVSSLGLVDSGTSLLAVPIGMASALQIQLETNGNWTNIFGIGFLTNGQCLSISAADVVGLDNLPSLSVWIDDGFELPLKPSRSLAIPFVINSATYYCPGIGILPADSPYSILGWSVLGQFGVVYEADRIGFAPVFRLPCDGLLMSRITTDDRPANSSVCTSSGAEPPSPGLAAFAVALFGLLSAPFFPLWNCPFISEN